MDQHEAITVLSTLAEPSRHKILLEVAREPNNAVLRTTALLGMGQPAVSHHLAMARAAGLVRGVRKGRTIRYSVHKHRVRELIEYLERSFVRED